MARRRADDCQDNYQRPTPTPAAEVIAEHNYGGIRTARILCPHCGQTHMHPWPAGDTSIHAAPCGLGRHYTIGGTQPTKGKPQ